LEISLFSEVAPIINETQNPIIIKTAKHRQTIVIRYLINDWINLPLVFISY